MFYPKKWSETIIESKIRMYKVEIVVSRVSINYYYISVKLSIQEKKEGERMAEKKKDSRFKRQK